MESIKRLKRMVWREKFLSDEGFELHRGEFHPSDKPGLKFVSFMLVGCFSVLLNKTIGNIRNKSSLSNLLPFHPILKLCQYPPSQIPRNIFSLQKARYLHLLLPHLDLFPVEKSDNIVNLGEDISIEQEQKSLQEQHEGSFCGVFGCDITVGDGGESNISKVERVQILFPYRSIIESIHCRGSDEPVLLQRVPFCLDQCYINPKKQAPHNMTKQSQQNHILDKLINEEELFLKIVKFQLTAPIPHLIELPYNDQIQHRKNIFFTNPHIRDNYPRKKSQQNHKIQPKSKGCQVQGEIFPIVKDNLPPTHRSSVKKNDCIKDKYSQQHNIDKQRIEEVIEDGGVEGDGKESEREVDDDEDREDDGPGDDEGGVGQQHPIVHEVLSSLLQSG